jgi:hypothetical protein
VPTTNITKILFNDMSTIRKPPDWVALIQYCDYFSFSLAGAHLNGEAREIGAQAVNGAQSTEGSI